MHWINVRHQMSNFGNFVLCRNIDEFFNNTEKMKPWLWYIAIIWGLFKISFNVAVTVVDTTNLINRTFKAKRFILYMGRPLKFVTHFHYVFFANHIIRIYYLAFKPKFLMIIPGKHSSLESLWGDREIYRWSFRHTGLK